MACNGIITADILADCLNGSFQGLETNVVLINREQIDFSSIVYDGANELLVTAFNLLSGNTGYCLEGVKQVNSSGYELVKKETSLDKFKHIFNGVVLTFSAENKLQLQNMSKGDKFIAIVEKKWKGASNAEAFDIYGLDVGLELNVSTFNTNENDGTAAFELSSADGFEEPKLPLNLLITDYATTKTAFDNKFIEA